MQRSGRDPLDILFASTPQLRQQRLDPEAELARQRLLARVLGHDEQVSVPLGRFEVVRCLGRGGMGTVFEATSPGTSGALALKVLEDASELALARLKREFRALRGLSHPHLVTMYELQVERDVPFFTMELIRGPSLLELLGSGRSLSVAFAERCLLQLTDALSTLHGRGILHGDIKPSNILVRHGGGVVVVDFGVARALNEPVHGVRSGTPAYLAPERLRGELFAQAADWYSLGAVLQELLDSVRAPRHQAGQARLAALSDLSFGLLRSDPRERFGARDIFDALGATSVQRSLGWPAEDAGFVGRERELERLRSALARARHGPVVCTVTGEAGMGKTALVEHFLALPELTDALTLRGRCYEGEYLPYRGVDGLIEGLQRFLLRLSEPARASLAGLDTDALQQVFPLLSDAGLPASSPNTFANRPRQVRHRAGEQLRRLLAAIARERALVIFIDDLQWADADGAALLAHLVSEGAPAMLLVASFRSDARGRCDAALASVVTEPVPIALEPLEAEACHRLACEARGVSVDRALSDTLLRESNGSPLLLHALLHAESAPRDRARTYAGLMSEVVGALDRPALELHELVVLAGSPVGLDLLTHAADHVEQPLLCLASLRARRRVRTVLADDSTHLLPHHDRLRELVTERIPASARPGYHARLAGAARALALDDPEFLAHHHFQAGEQAEAGVHAERAGDRARSTMALDRARQLYQRALECAAPSRPVGLVEKLADVAASVGDLVQAGPLYLEAAAGCPRDSWLLRLRAAEVFLQRGAGAEGMRLLRPALREGQIQVPTSMVRAAWMGGLSLLRSHRASQPSHWFDAPADAPDDARTELAFRAGHLIVLHDAKGVALILWSAARALRHGSSSQRGRALASLAYVYCLLGLRTNDEQDALVSRSLALTASDPLAHVAALANKALVAFARCSCDEALSALDTIRALVVEHRLDVQWILGQVHSLAASVCVLAGDFCRVDQFGPDAEREARELGNRTALAQMQSALAWSAFARGDGEAMRRYTTTTLEEWRSRWVSPMYGIAVWGESQRLLYEGETSAAYALMQIEVPRFARAAFARTQMWSTSLGHMWGSVELACARAARDPHFRAAERHATRLERRELPCARALATLLRAGLARRAEQPAVARAAYAKARHDFTALGMRGYAAAAAYREAQLGEPSDERALAWFAEQSVADPACWVRMYAP